jgi:hypothetical protein
VKDTTIDESIKMPAAQKASHSIGISSAPIFAQSHFLWGFWLGGKRRGELIWYARAEFLSAQISPFKSAELWKK